MPFAASVIDKYASKYFQLDQPLEYYKYMTNCLETKNLGKSLLSAAIHPYDKTCRPQILIKKDNPFYYSLISHFGKKTGIYGLLNTSFNLHGYPIVNNSSDAIRVFKETNLDGLILSNYLIIKK